MKLLLSQFADDEVCFVFLNHITKISTHFWFIFSYLIPSFSFLSSFSLSNESLFTVYNLHFDSSNRGFYKTTASQVSNSVRKRVDVNPIENSIQVFWKRSNLYDVQRTLFTWHWISENQFSRWMQRKYFIASTFVKATYGIILCRIININSGNRCLEFNSMARTWMHALPEFQTQNLF